MLHGNARMLRPLFRSCASLVFGRFFCFVRTVCTYLLALLLALSLGRMLPVMTGLHDLFAVGGLRILLKITMWIY